MPLAFSASQQLSLPTIEPADLLPDYLDDEARVVAALLDDRQLVPLGPGHYLYTVTRVQVFQLQVQPIVELQARHQQGRLELEAVDCQLEGLGLVDDFKLQLHSWLQATDSGLEGEARLAVEVSQPPLLRLIPPRVLEATGRSLLSGILLGIRRRVGQQLAGDFQAWCHGRAEGFPDP
ncbi:MAG: DUF1997 domain-containing protein [Cyanobacteria bacterium]|jgi:hypothetical protein|nr:DUF1997 domain-containing protein [Cyanobacteriota bacterium]